MATGQTKSERGAELAVRQEYARLAGEYDRRWSGYVAATVRQTLRRMDLRASDRLLDVGCGTGALLEAVKRVVPNISAIGIDLAPEMIGIARGRLSAAAGFVAANAEELPFRSGTFDIVVSTSSFHYWTQPRRALAEIARILHAGGRLIITDWCDDYLACRLCDLALRLVDRAHQRSYSREEYQWLLQEAGYEVRTIERYKITWL